ncbi:MAG: SDR family NAD(P)-dependent oxidoreductase [Candidatus Promineifilaceae bacterium]
MTNLSQKTILLTGATGGFGQHFMRQLLAKGGRLIVSDLDAGALAALAQKIHNEVGAGEIVASIGGDLSTRHGVDALWSEVEALGEPIDVLINNAGIGFMGRHDEVPQDKWERLMQVNLLSPMRLCAFAAPQMIARRDGHIVNIASLASWMADIGMTAYAASKYGLRGFSEALADELEKHNVRVSAVYPFYSNTAILDSPRYGTLAAEHVIKTDRSKATNPADVVRETIAAIEADRMPIFPDKIGRFLYKLKRYTPSVFNFFKSRFSAAESS